MKWSIHKRWIIVSLFFLLFLNVLQIAHAWIENPTPLTSKVENVFQKISRTSTDYSTKIKRWYKKNNTVLTVLPDLFKVRVVDAWIIIFCILLPFGLLIRYLFR